MLDANTKSLLYITTILEKLKNDIHDKFILHQAFIKDLLAIARLIKEEKVSLNDKKTNSTIEECLAEFLDNGCSTLLYAEQSTSIATKLQCLQSVYNNFNIYFKPLEEKQDISYLLENTKIISVKEQKAEDRTKSEFNLILSADYRKSAEKYFSNNKSSFNAIEWINIIKDLKCLTMGNTEEWREKFCFYLNEFGREISLLYEEEFGESMPCFDDKDFSEIKYPESHEKVLELQNHANLIFKYQNDCAFYRKKYRRDTSDIIYKVFKKKFGCFFADKNKLMRTKFYDLAPHQVASLLMEISGMFEDMFAARHGDFPHYFHVYCISLFLQSHYSSINLNEFWKLFIGHELRTCGSASCAGYVFDRPFYIDNSNTHHYDGGTRFTYHLSRKKILYDKNKYHNIMDVFNAYMIADACNNADIRKHLFLNQRYKLSRDNLVRAISTEYPRNERISLTICGDSYGISESCAFVHKDNRETLIIEFNYVEYEKAPPIEEEVAKIVNHPFFVGSCLQDTTRITKKPHYLQAK